MYDSGIFYIPALDLILHLRSVSIKNHVNQEVTHIDNKCNNKPNIHRHSPCIYLNPLKLVLKVYIFECLRVRV